MTGLFKVATGRNPRCELPALVILKFDSALARHARFQFAHVKSLETLRFHK